MAPQQQRAGNLSGHGLQIGQSRALGRDGAGEGHVKILLPAHQRVVRPAEGKIGPPVAQTDGDGGKLGLGLRVELLFVMKHRHLPEADALAHGRQQAGVAPAQDAAGKIRPGGKLCRHLPQGGRFPAQRAGKQLEGQVGEPGQQNAVHRVQGRCGKRQIAPPVQIIKQICHEDLPRSRGFSKVALLYQSTGKKQEKAPARRDLALKTGLYTSIQEYRNSCITKNRYILHKRQNNSSFFLAFLRNAFYNEIMSFCMLLHEGTT